MYAFKKQIAMTSLAAVMLLLFSGMVIGIAPSANAEGAPPAEAPAPVKDKPVEAVKEAADTAEAGFSKTHALIAGLTIFVLAIFVGFEVITKVPPTLHTPLMSGSNAISGITIVGAILVIGAGESTMMVLLGLLALILATINVVGGFLVTHRMLAMFKRP